MGLVETIERRRAEFIADQNKQGKGTFGPFAEAIRKNRMAAMQKDMEPKSEAEKPNAK